MTPDRSRVLLIGLLVSLGGFVFGYDAVVISGVIDIVEARFGLTEWQVGWVVSAPTFSAMFASLAIGPLADRFGRRSMLLTVSALYILSALLSTAATGFITLSLARLVGGLAFSSLVVAPVFLAEIAPARSRGGVVSMNQMAIVLGLSGAYVMNLTILSLSRSGADWVTWLGMDDAAWRWMLGAELVPAVLWMAALVFAVPESPRWLVMKSRIEEAMTVLGRVRDREEAAEAVRRIRLTLPDAATPGPRFKALFRHPVVRAMLGIALIVAIAQQVTGVNAIYFYAPTVFKQSGVGASAAFLQAAALGITNVAFTIVAILTIDRIGRRPLLIIGLVGVTVSMFIAATGFLGAEYRLDPQLLAALPDRAVSEALAPMAGQLYDSDTAFRGAAIELIGPRTWALYEAELLQAGVTLNAPLVLVSILLFVASFAVSLGPVTWVLLSEIFPNAYRGMAIALVAFINSLVSFCVQLVFPVQLHTIGVATTFLIYGSLAAVFLVLVIRFVPETKGETLEGLLAAIEARRRR